MSDSNSFTSLLSLVDSHLSKVNIQESQSEDTGRIHQIKIPSLTDTQNGTQSESRLFTPSQRLPLPAFNISPNPITSILAEQVANMLKAKELKKKEEEEKLRLAEEMEKLKVEDDDYIIDLMPTVNTSEEMQLVLQRKEIQSTSSSSESLFEPPFIDCDIEPEPVKTPEPELPCITDMSYILSKKIKKGKCSVFGRVLTARLKPVAAPYLRDHIESTIPRFKFDVKSPCDLIKEIRMKRRTTGNAYVDLMQAIMSEPYLSC